MRISIKISIKFTWSCCWPKQYDGCQAQRIWFLASSSFLQEFYCWLQHTVKEVWVTNIFASWQLLIHKFTEKTMYERRAIIAFWPPACTWRQKTDCGTTDKMWNAKQQCNIISCVILGIFSATWDYSNSFLHFNDIVTVCNECLVQIFCILMWNVVSMPIFESQCGCTCLSDCFNVWPFDCLVVVLFCWPLFAFSLWRQDSWHKPVIALVQWHVHI